MTATYAGSQLAADTIVRALATGTSLCLPFPMREGRYMAQIVIPRDMTQDEAERLCAFVRSLAQPEGE